MRFLAYIFFATIIAGMSSCGDTGYTIKGKIENAANMTIYFDRVQPMENINSVVAKGESNGSGSYSMTLEIPPEPGTYRLRAGAKSAFLVLDGTEKSLVINGDVNTINNYEYTVEGSAASAEYVDAMRRYVAGETPIDDVKKFILEDASPSTAMMMGLQLFGGAPEFADVHERVSAKLRQVQPEAASTQQYAQFAQSMRQQLQRKQAMEKVKVGEIAPDITLPDVDGRERKLSELRGQVVLLDFWASWCGPCRRENPNVVRVYDKYNKDGFTVFSVSLDGLDDRTKARFPADQIQPQLDEQKRRWLAAIEKDNLKWDSHVSDLKKWQSAGASLYGVRSIPRTFLLDRDGRIAYVNPRHNLEQAVQSLL